jgi:hypothetical protein
MKNDEELAESSSRRLNLVDGTWLGLVHGENTPQLSIQSPVALPKSFLEKGFGQTTSHPVSARRPTFGVWIAGFFWTTAS